MKRLLSVLAACAIIACAATAWAASKGQLLYVPCSSHVYQGVKSRPFDLTVTLMVRNTDPWRALRLTAVDYHGSDGRLIKRFLDKVVTVPPLTTKEYMVEQNDTSGGAGALFLVRWQSDAPMNDPIAESVMIGTTNGQGISFTQRGVVIQQ